VTTAIAIYAAIIATASVGWQVFVWTVQHRTRLTVYLWGEVEPVLGVDMSIIGENHVAKIKIRNRGGCELRVEAIGFMQEHLSVLTDVQWRAPESSPPGIIPPRDNRECTVLLEDLEMIGINFAEPAAAWVELASGREFRSTPVTFNEATFIPTY